MTLYSRSELAACLPAPLAVAEIMKDKPMERPILHSSTRRGAAAIMFVAGIAASTGAGAIDTSKRSATQAPSHSVIASRRCPFAYLDAGKQPIGYSMDLCRKVVGALKRELNMPNLAVKLAPVTPASRIPDLLAGKIDLECGSTTNNAERRKQVAFTVATYIAGAKYVYKAKSGIKGLDDLAKKAVVTTQGTTTEKILRGLDEQNSMHMDILLGKDHAESFSHVAGGKAQAFFMDDILLYSLRAESGAPQDYEVSGSCCRSSRCR
jgi:glutamate/aspartate transport system substrate-binding protein